MVELGDPRRQLDLSAENNCNLWCRVKKNYFFLNFKFTKCVFINLPSKVFKRHGSVSKKKWASCTLKGFKEKASLNWNLELLIQGCVFSCLVGVVFCICRFFFYLLLHFFPLHFLGNKPRTQADLKT